MARKTKTRRKRRRRKVSKEQVTPHVLDAGILAAAAIRVALNRIDDFARMQFALAGVDPNYVTSTIPEAEEDAAVPSRRGRHLTI